MSARGYHYWPRSYLQEFGDDVALLVDGVTKIRTFQIKTLQERQAETYRKMLLSMAKDLRVIIIKFADRLHNLRTLKYLEPDRIKAIAWRPSISTPLGTQTWNGKDKMGTGGSCLQTPLLAIYKNIVAKVVANRGERETTIDSFVMPAPPS